MWSNDGVQRFGLGLSVGRERSARLAGVVLGLWLKADVTDGPILSAVVVPVILLLLTLIVVGEVLRRRNRVDDDDPGTSRNRSSSHRTARNRHDERYNHIQMATRSAKSRRVVVTPRRYVGRCAEDLRLLRDHHRDVLRRPSASALPRQVRRVRSTGRNRERARFSMASSHDGPEHSSRSGRNCTETN